MVIKKKAIKAIRNHKDRASPQPGIAEKVGISDHAEKATGVTGRFPIVGIGASAGALPAFEAFFSGMPANTETGMAFVLVQHLAPDHKSMLVELLRRMTRMQVYEIEDGMTVQPDCVYVIPPNRDIALMNGALQLLEPALPSGHRLSIDFFFRSLAQDRHEQAIGIVLSGTGTDGTLGVRAIKGEGGMVMAQDIASSEYDGMPRSAIATGLVDYELSPAEMFLRLRAYVDRTTSNSFLLNTATAKADNKLKKILVVLRNQTGHDFSQYKRNPIQRRIERRMIIHQITEIEGYLKYIQQTPEEAEILFQELLIGVTNFFRDPEAFKALEDKVIPKLFVDRPVDSAIRVWVPGCSTGEEAYSIAILLAERQETMKQSYKVQIFATDIDGRAITAARAGIYPASIASDMSQERLKRFFLADGSIYRINKGIRDMLVFSEHNLIKDPPFSRLDLISCRNLLIYLGGDLQKKIIPLFHYALNPKGFLFQGTSETVADFNYLFTVLDRKLKLYQRKDHVHRMQKMAAKQFLSPQTDVSVSLPQDPGKTSPPAKKTPMRELTEQALLQRAPAAVLVNNQGDILYFHGRTGMYLEPALGDAGVSNIFAMAREGLRYVLVTALHKAVVGKEIVHYPGLRVKNNGDFSSVNLSVQPIAPDPDSQNGFLYLVILETSPVQPIEEVREFEIGEDVDSGAANALLAQLRRELSDKDEYLQAIREKLETSNDDLRSKNEEMQSVIEELQSTNEELETSTEELQSVNEEIISINNELQTNMINLSQANDDMTNMLGGTGIGIIFVDHKLRILRFTPTVTEIINLIPSDVGRPVAHIVSNLVGYDNLVADTQAVLSTLIPKEVEVQISGGKWYALRIKPYRTSANVIEGAVVTFMDITEMKHDREALHQANARLRLAVVVRDAHDAITVQDLDGRIIAWNQGAVRMYGWSEAEALTMNASDRVPEELRAEALVDIYRLSLTQKLEPCRTQRLAKDGTLVEIWLTSTALVNEAGKMYAIMTTERSEHLNLDPMTRMVKYVTSEHDRPRIGSELRRLAEELIERKAALSQEGIEDLSSEETRRIFHELRVNQIELEMQNVQLREVQVALEASQARYFDLYDLAPVGYCTVSKQGLILEVNLKAATLLGMTRTSLAGQPISPRFIHKEDRGDYYLLHNRLFETDEPQGCELRMVKRDGTAFWVHLSASLAQDEGGSPQCRIVFTDISERKRVEDALRQNEKALFEREQRLQLFVEHAPASLAMFDREMRYLRVSRRWANDYGLGDRELRGLSHYELLNIPERWKEAHRRGLAGEVLRVEDDYYNRPDGSVWRVCWEIRPWYDISGDIGGIVIFAEDITERKKVEQQLQSYNEDLEKRVEQRTRELKVAQAQHLHSEKLATIGQLSASIAHEFNNPLQGVITILQGLKKGRGLEEKDREMLDLAISESNRMKDLIRSLQDFNRPSSGEKIFMDVHASIDSLLLLCKSDFRHKGISTVKNYAERLPQISAIPDQIKQVFLNLLKNAADACLQNERVITISTWQVKQRVAVEIKDTGVGIQPEKIDQIFQPFYTTKSAVKGTGLGLSVCHGIIQHHHGEIRVASQPGEGSTFTVLLPIQD